MPKKRGFAGRPNVPCPKARHGVVLWCVCMETPEQRKTRRAQEWAFWKKLARTIGFPVKDVLRALSRRSRGAA